MTNNAQSTLARLAGRTVANHVANGGWLGASWPQYTCGWLDQETLDSAIAEAQEINPNLWVDSERNFNEEALCAIN